MPADEYTKNLNAVIARKLEKDKTLNEETSRHWQEIAKHRYTFNRGTASDSIASQHIITSHHITSHHITS